MAFPTETIAAALRAATALFTGVSETPRLDAELLMAQAIGCTRSDLLLRQADLVVPVEFAGLVARRMADEPVAYITGRQDFWDLTLAVTPDVLIPRADSETLIEAAVDAFAGREGPQRILDLGTGSGALLLAALSAFPAATGLGVDASKAALAVAAGNANMTGFADCAEFRHLNWRDADWVEELTSPTVRVEQRRDTHKARTTDRPLVFARGEREMEVARYDLILCNPPYIEDGFMLAPMVTAHEPHSALFAGPDGLDDYRILIPAIPALLAPGGVAIFEIGFNQAQSVSDLASKAGLSTEMRRDLGGNPRCLRFSLGIGEAGG